VAARRTRWAVLASLTLAAIGCGRPPLRPDGGPVGSGGDANTGTSGSTGTSGGAGTTGSAGTTGNAGTTGSAGTTGNAGATAAAGTTGAAGTAGASSGGTGGGIGGAVGTGGSMQTEKKPLGAACQMATECASAFCNDGVCCGMACAGPCRSCGIAGSLGVCVPVAAGLICAAPTCVGNTFTKAATCDGQGSCRTPASSSCGTAGCHPSGMRCYSGCPGGDATCLGGFYCTGDEECYPQKDPGVACGSNHECKSAFCVAGACGPLP